MASSTLLTPEQYLQSRFEGLEPEYAHGELVERSMPNVIHGWLQLLIAMRMVPAGFPVVGVRVRLASDLIRIPDIALFPGSLPKELVPTTPPLVIVEIISPDDRHSEVLRKLKEYRDWGVEHIWVVEPDLRQMHVYDGKSPVSVEAFTLPEFTITATELFADF